MNSTVMKSIPLTPEMELHIADFSPDRTVEMTFETRRPVLRFYFYVSANGHWELHSPQNDGPRRRLDYADRHSCVYFYPELEGKMQLQADHRQFHLSAYITPELLSSYLGEGIECFPKEIREISEGCLTKGFCHGGPLPRIMAAAIDDLLQCPYTGCLKRLYMEGKVIELIAHKLAQLSLPEPPSPTVALPPRDVERIRQARDILCKDLENPPKLLELARLAGINHGKLNAGFRELFGATVFGYLRRMRLLEAKRLLDAGDMNVTEVALSVGYNSLPSFSKAFSEFFGLPPMQCLKKRFRSFG